MEGTAQKIERENKEYQKQIENRIWEELEKQSIVAIKIPNGSWVLPHVSATFRNAGYDPSYDPDEQVLTVRKDAPESQSTQTTVQ